MPHRSQRVIDQVLHLVGDRSRFQLERLLRRFEGALGEAIRAEQDAEVLGDLLASREALVRNGHHFLPAFLASLRQACMDAYDHVAPAPTAGPAALSGLRLQPLRLLDDSIVDEEGALASIAARHESRTSLPLVLLGQRFAVLLERPPLPADALPVGPLAICRALRHAATEVGLRLHARMALYRLYDTEEAERYETTLQAIDALVDGAGILQGLSFVPLRPRDVVSHPERGRGSALGDIGIGTTPELVAIRVVNETLDSIVPSGTLPEERLAERREAVAAMVRLVTRYGPESPEWARCKQVIADVIGATRERRAVDPETTAWIRASLQALGYDASEGLRLALALAHMGSDVAGTAREQAELGEAARDWQQRLVDLPEGTTLGFTGGSGVLRARLRRRAATSDRVLLASEEEGKEAWVDVETVARLMAEGHAWVVHGTGEPQ